MGAVPKTLREALRPITVVAGHYGVGKTNFCVNLALDAAAAGVDVTLIDLDVVNPYFRASEQRALLEDAGVHLVAPVFAETGSSLDVPSLTGSIAPALERARALAEDGAASSDGLGALALVDAGGDDVGARALGRFARFIGGGDYALLYVLNRNRNLVADVDGALSILREIEAAARLSATALVGNTHLKDETSVGDIERGLDFARGLERATDLPLACVTAPRALLERFPADRVLAADDLLYAIETPVRNPWE